MGLKRPKKYGIWCILADCILLIELIIDIKVGRFTWPRFLIIISLILLTTAIAVPLIKKAVGWKKE